MTHIHLTREDRDIVLLVLLMLGTLVLARLAAA
jgi:hypothetical protein